jgi:hypothetical protein
MESERPTADFIVEAPDRSVQLVVEVKNAKAHSPEWAAQFLRNLSMHASIPQSEYFLLALQDRFYLWHHPDPIRKSLPDFEGNPESVLKPYLEGSRTSLDRLTEQSFELLIFSWLNDLVRGNLPASAELDWIKTSGLSNSTRNGTVKTQIAA